MADEIKSVLTKLLNNGFEAYIVGGYVRDYLMGNNTLDIDICTNAVPKDITAIFNDDNIKVSNYGSVKLRKNNYNFDITTYKRELNYENDKPTKIIYINNLEEDILRRDFTMNGLYMDIDGTIIDKVNGKNDIKEGIIKVIGNLEDRFLEDKVRILRALRFSVVLNFKLEPSIIDYIKNNKNSIKNISQVKKKEELSKMLVSNNILRGLEYLKSNDLLDVFDIDYNNITYVDDISGMYAQLDFKVEYPFSKEEKDNIKAIKFIEEYGKIDYGILFQFGLYISLVASKIMKLDLKKINNLYNEMPIKSIKELKLDGNDVIRLLNITPGKIVKDILDDLVFLVLNKKISNEKEVLEQYVLSNKGK